MTSNHRAAEAKRGREAIVIGASMGGLLAARALADHYEHVTLLERDTLPPPGHNRKGVGQGWHAHALLARGREVLEGLFPGLTQALAAQGAPVGDVSQLALWYHQGDYHARLDSGLDALAVSRPALEGEVRARLAARENVQIIERCDVLGLLTDDARQRVTGVRCRRHEPGAAEETLPADLVVDASGRGSHTPRWLEALGYHRPPEEQVKVGIGYATRYYRRAGGQLKDLNAVVMTSEPPRTRAGVALAQEGERWVVTLVGYLGDHPPVDEGGFLEFARSLPRPEIYDLITSTEPLTGVLSYKYPVSVRRRYERLRRFPEGYLVFGDALCSFNPIFGQGMTVCATEALALAECLQNGTARLAQRFFAQASRLIDAPWSVAVGADLRYPAVEGARGPMVRFINKYISRLHVAAWQDPQVALAFLKVINLMAPPQSLLAPATAWRVLRGNLRPARSAARAWRLEVAPEERQPA
jgi:2-polyprenyl-6-methoxyphenol hydroxylase-like FAD-dependent oxidoreductase